jgi:serine/threonine protein kinase
VLSRNIFRTGETLLIGDLGLVKSMESIASFAGTPYYMSPESLKEIVGYFTDMW